MLEPQANLAAPVKERKEKVGGKVWPWQWTALETNFVLLIGIIILINLNLWNLLHYKHPSRRTFSVPHHEELSRMLHQESGRVADGISEDDIDYDGNLWTPIFDRNTIVCLNLDGEIKKTSWTTEEEKQTWADLNCGALLKAMFERWKLQSGHRKEECDRLATFGIIPGETWGDATPSQKKQWGDMACDCHYESGWNDMCLSGFPPHVHNTTVWRGIEEAAHSREGDERIVSPHGTPAMPIIAVTVGTTSRSFRWSKLDESPLFGILLPSIARTLEKGFEYRVYVGYDTGDLFYDNADRIAEANAWAKEHVETPAREKGHVVTVKFVSFLNILRKPGPMFNFLAACAFGDGADYVYRVNDDTELRTIWAGAFVTALANMQPANLGVVGPKCPEGNYRILTHDFVHRIHKDIFKVYYPVVLTDWWMDDWISRVYPMENTMRHEDVWVTHHTWVSGSGNPVRYHVDHSHKKFLEHELRHGYTLIEDYKRNRCAGGGTCKVTDGVVTLAWSEKYDADKIVYLDSVVKTRMGSSFEDSSSVYGEDDDMSGAYSQGGVEYSVSGSLSGSQDTTKEPQDDDDWVLHGVSLSPDCLSPFHTLSLNCLSFPDQKDRVPHSAEYRSVDCFR